MTTAHDPAEVARGLDDNFAADQMDGVNAWLDADTDWRAVAYLLAAELAYWPDDVPGSVLAAAPKDAAR